MERGKSFFAAVLLVACVLLAIPKSAAQNLPGKKPITLIFRFDDYSARTDTDLELKVFQAFRQHHLPLTVGVVPYVVDGDVHSPAPQNLLPLPPFKAQILKQQIQSGPVEVAQHGYSHQALHGDSQLTYSEFAGMDYRAQMERLRKGRELLESLLGVSVTTFIPPYNAYDWNTTRALRELGYTCLSADPNGPADSAAALRLIPKTSQLPTLRRDVNAARQFAGTGPLIIVEFHHFDFRENDAVRGHMSVADLPALLAWVKAQDDVAVVNLQQAAQGGHDLGPARLLSNRYPALDEITPPFFHAGLFRNVHAIYLSAPAARRLQAKRWGVLLALYAGIAALAFFLAGWSGERLFPRSQKFARFAVLSAPLMVLGLTLYSFRHFLFGYRGPFAIAAALGVTLGVWRAYHGAGTRRSS